MRHIFLFRVGRQKAFFSATSSPHCFWRKSDVWHRKASMSKATFNFCCLDSALEPNQTSFSCLFSIFFLLVWVALSPETCLHCQEMALNIVWSGEEDCFLMSNWCVLHALATSSRKFGCAASCTEECGNMSLGSFSCTRVSRQNMQINLAGCFDSLGFRSVIKHTTVGSFERLGKRHWIPLV